MIQNFDKNKYINLLKSDGLSHALTTLHQDMWNFEFDTFEGQEGWQPVKWDRLNEMRKFSRELWEYGQGIEAAQPRKS